MHGRVKVKTTEEQAAAIRAEKKEKATLFKSLRNKIMAMRAANDASTNDKALALTEALLEKNPDFLTVFNFRRSVLESYKEAESSDFDVRMRDELVVATACLKKNPKSYSAWQHRRWCLTSCVGIPPLEEELALTTKYLKLDSRNFHCWDYRRFVVSMLEDAGTSMTKSELAFSKEKIVENFSNYSAWHYRSKILMGMHGVKYGLELPEDVLANELEFVTDPIFIDPADQSSWIYLQWLLSKAPPPLRIHRALLHGNTITLVLNKSAKVTKTSLLLRADAGDEALTPANVEAVDEDGAVWVLSLPKVVQSVALSSPPPASSLPPAEQQQLAGTTTRKSAISLPDDTLMLSQDVPFCPQLRGGGAQELPAQVAEMVDTISELLDELSSEDSVGVLTTLTFLLTEHAPFAKDTIDKCTSWYQRLAVADPFRRGYYNEMLRRLLVIDAVLDVSPTETSIDISAITEDDALAQMSTDGEDVEEKDSEEAEIAPLVGPAASLVEGLEFAPWLTHVTLSSFNLSKEDVVRLRALPRLDSIEVGDSARKRLDLELSISQ